MKQLTIGILLLVLGACGGERRPVVVTTGVIEVAPLPAPTSVVFQTTNDDLFDYALWLEWQDETGEWVQIFLFALYGDPYVGPTQDYEIFLATPGVTYTVLLADPEGALYDWRDFQVPAESVAYVSFQIVGGYLVRTL